VETAVTTIDRDVLRGEVVRPDRRQPRANWWHSPYGRALRRLLRNRAAMISLIGLLAVVVIAALADLLAPYPPLKMSILEAMQPPSVKHWFGTDQFGRDILSRVIHGARLSVPLGLIPVVIGSVLGTCCGLIAGYVEGWPRRVIMRGVDVLLGFPLFLLALFIVAMLGPSLVNAMLALGVAGTPAYARVVYSSVLSVRERDYIIAARALGTSEVGILLRHVLPNVVAPVVVVATLGMAYAILTGASLSFLGLGAQPPTPEWGAMVYEGRDYLRVQWWISTLPGLMIALAVLAVNILGDGLRDALDPRLMD
jgi:ABC-type dipeptide/oligopeptide/nickel transport system permease subunit